ncbi:MAG: cysteine--tRNA ligase [Candidatus Magasanikbacteria bacterium]|nr:cysteine--tRNA ligase [Candidatus Magasanikbacteria bacterium]|tara:strand:- start:4762 stop:6129 length:1368 start_codon:yes stop_codon:yes gene_type:complete
MLYLYNSRTKEKEAFVPIYDHHANMYTCGPTVYNYAHIGNLRTYIFEDILRRVLKYNGYKVKHVMNITDVGHLTDDADQGEDKMEKGSKREGKTAWEIAEFYEKAFKKDVTALNILEPTIWCKATDHIEEQIAMVTVLLEKNHAYKTTDGIYFDTTSIPDYGEIANIQNQKLDAGSRVDMGEKKNIHDFALWKFTKEGESRQMEWVAFEKKGFPGWHIECSAMAVKYLGEQFDIHCGGIDHIPVHHTNEVAQTEAVTEKKPWVKYWLHGEFLLIEKDKMAKSGENFITLQTLKEKGIDPLAYRYFLLQAHYRKQLHFTFEALEAASQGLKRLKHTIANISDEAVEDMSVVGSFLEAINDDLNTPEALAILWKGLKNNVVTKEMVTDFDKVLGLKLLDLQTKEEIIPENIQILAEKRAQARNNKDWGLSDSLRDEITTLGYDVEDTPDGQHLYKQE